MTKTNFYRNLYDLKYGLRYSRIDHVKFVEDSLLKISDIVCINNDPENNRTKSQILKNKDKVYAMYILTRLGQCSIFIPLENVNKQMFSDIF